MLCACYSLRQNHCVFCALVIHSGKIIVCKASAQLARVTGVSLGRDVLALRAQQEGHGPDWIYQGGPPPGPIKGSRSHYYNEWKWDSDPETGGDFVAGSNVPEEDLQNENFVANEQVRWSFLRAAYLLFGRWFKCATHALPAYFLFLI
jgi:hypothetical protein